MLMSNNKKSRKQRSDKFPLTLHPTGQFCKKIKGKLNYFGIDKKNALQRYIEQAAMLHSGKTHQIIQENKRISIEYICNTYLEHQQSMAMIGQIKIRHICDQKILLRDFVSFVGQNCLVGNIATIDVQNYISGLIKKKKSANTINNRIAVLNVSIITPSMFL